ncbi:MAG TPA: hypothetical protein VN881_06295 [Candidatus Acidoferrales bacterium]|nr:hypothetical protein [Candidatus Acidoferrales bacterium]
MTEAENPDRAQLNNLLQQAKPLMLPLYADQQKKWLAESPLAQEIKAILQRHPEYFDDVSAVVGPDVFQKPKS